MIGPTTEQLPAAVDESVEQRASRRETALQLRSLAYRAIDVDEARRKLHEAEGALDQAIARALDAGVGAGLVKELVKGLA